MEVKDFVTLIVLDGFGVHPDPEGNAVIASKTPFLDTAWTYGRATLVNAGGTYVGLPADSDGNSEVGHLNIGAGQVVYQTLPRINDAIDSHELDSNPVLRDMVSTVRQRGTDIHLMGILTPANVHGNIKHLFSLLEICKANGLDPYLHIMLDGRDDPPHNGYIYMSKLLQKMKELGIGHISSIMGRFYGMDRDTRWERVKLAYDAMVGLAEETFTDPLVVIKKAYINGEDDQFFKPRTAINTDGTPVGVIKEGDVVLFWNFREDRAREITGAFVRKDFNEFVRRNYPKNLYFVTMTGYEKDLPVHVIFPPLPVKKSLSETLADNGKAQFHISETEKHMHVTYFFDGGTELLHTGEEIVNIPSQRVDNYAKTPAMSAEGITSETLKVLKNIKMKPYGFVLINFANPDMLGHTGDFNATVQGLEIMDAYLSQIAQETLKQGGALMITADHGNCETMIDRITKEIDVAHTANPVPFIILTNPEETRVKAGVDLYKIGTGPKARATGLLADVAPTCLSILNEQIPANMTGVDLRTML
jgi:2,3-bisphosphoglycerate-independent phosphoglycerate mutase